MIQTTQNITVDQALQIGDAIGIDWNIVDIQQFRRGIEVELEHGLIDANTNVTSDDLLVTGKIALAHLNEMSDYYTKLDMMETTTPIQNNSTNTISSSLNLILGAAAGIGAVVLFNKFKNK